MDIQTTLISIFSVFFMASAFPDNLTPISTKKDFKTRVFTGDDIIATKQLQYLKIMKRITIDGHERIAIASRENLYFLNPSKFSNEAGNDNIDYDEIVTWTSANETRDLCMMKGESKDLCRNYLNLLETTNQNEFMLCGTNAFTPMCAHYRMSVTGEKLSLTRFGDFFSGEQRIPYHPNRPIANLFTDGSLYAATFQNFAADSPLISRTLGKNPPLRTSINSERLGESSFVQMTEDDKRVLVYFNEINELADGERRSIAQVAQVCKNDVGGKLVLQRTWTTFLKSRLNCSYNGFYLDQIRDVTNPIVIGNQSVVFASFATPESSLPGSAICSFSLDSIHSSMAGRFQVTGDINSEGASTIPPVNSRHPGSCPSEKPTDSELIFIRAHPQMAKQVDGDLQMTFQGTRWNAIAVDPAAGANNVTMLFIGREDGHLIRALAPYSNWPKGAVVSDQNVFIEERCSKMNPTEDKKIIKIMLTGDSILVAFTHCVVSVPLRSCEIHQCKSACIGSADPYCGWNGEICASFIQPNPSIEQDIPMALMSAHDPCPNIPLIMEEEVTVAPIKVSPTSLLATNVENIYEVEEPEKSVEEQMYPQYILIIVVVVTFVFTLLLVVLLVLLKRCIYLQQSGENEKHDFQKTQLEEHRRAIRPDEKRGSLTRKARHTYHCWMGFLRRNVTPAPTPQVPPKNNSNSVKQRRRQNEYTEASTLQYHVEEAQKMRKASSRLSSICSTTSRQDSIGCSQPSQPLLHHTDDSVSSEATFPRHHRLSYQPVCNSPCSSETTHSSSYHVESGTLPTASAKLRRRNERVLNRTNEIMRDSDTAIRDFESTLRQMQQHGFSSQPLYRMPNHLIRQRLNSDDSGKGESPRNSLQTDAEQPVAVYTSHTQTQRPTSLNLHRTMSENRQRLNSEPSYAHNITVKRHSSLRSSNGKYFAGSQPNKPLEVHKLSAIQPINEESSLYATMPKPSMSVMIGGHKQHRQPQVYQQTNFQQDCEQIGVVTSGSPQKGPPNMYPSLQVRGPYAHKMPYPQQWTNPPPTNHYPSLPHKSSSALFGHSNNNNSYMTGPGFERPATLHRREKLPSIMRRTSTPASTRPAMFVPPPTVPDAM